MNIKSVFLGTCGAFIVVGGAFADNIVTTKTYVDNKVPAYNSATESQSLLADTTTTGTIAKRAIYSDTAANYDSTTQSAYIPTMGAVMSAISANAPTDVSTHTVNGAPLSNSASYFYGESSTAAATAQKEVSIPSITSLQTGQIIVVKPTATSTAGGGSLKLNDFDAYPMWYNGAALTTTTDSIAWSAQIPSVWLFDGSHWRFVARGYDSNTTYSTMSVDEGTTGRATANRVLQAANLKQIIQGTKLTGLSTSDATAVTETDTITTGIGKLQAQITDVAADIPTLPTGTAGTAVLYDNNGNIGDERAISDAAVYTGSGKSRELSNGANLATITAVETKQNAITPGTNGNLVEYNGADENGQALFTARSVMDDSDVVDAISNSDGSWQGMGTEIKRNYTNDIVSGGAMGAALEELGNAVDVLASLKPRCVQWNSGNTVCYAWRLYNAIEELPK